MVRLQRKLVGGLVRLQRWFGNFFTWSSFAELEMFQGAFFEMSYSDKVDRTSGQG